MFIFAVAICGLVLLPFAAFYITQNSFHAKHACRQRQGRKNLIRKGRRKIGVSSQLLLRKH